MKNLIFALLVLILPIVADAQTEKAIPDEVKNILSESLQDSSSSLGTRFIIGFPPNEREAGFPTQNLAMYIAAPEETRVKLSTSSGQFLEEVIPANEVGLFATVNNKLTWGLENWQHEREISGKAVIVESDKPVSIYVMNSKVTTSEGYLAIPVASWGDAYVHMSFYDFREGEVPWAGGFQVLAAEKNTKVRIELKGLGAGIATTTGGREIGDIIRVTLDEGEIYQVQGDGETRGVFDLSGSVITADKPIGVISYHNRTMIPKFIVSNGRDNLMAMVPPIQTWGTEYVTIELDRGTGRGDYYRIVAAESETEVNVSWYDLQTNEKIDETNSTLNAFEVWAPYEIDGDLNSNPPLTSINGSIVIKSNKPIMVMQYAYSERWDLQGGQFDPFMFPVTAVEQYTSATIFQSPKNFGVGGQEFNENFFNLFFVGDANDVNATLSLASSIHLDGVPLTTLDPSAGLKNIPTTNIFYSRLKVGEGFHTIYGDPPMGGYIYGFSRNDSYAWPAISGFNNIYDFNLNSSVFTTFEDLEINAYPMPASDQLYVVGNEIYKYDIMMVDINGRSIPVEMIKESGKIKLELGNLAKGYYSIVLTSEKSAAIKNIIIE